MNAKGTKRQIPVWKETFTRSDGCCQPDKPWKRETSVEELPPSDWPVALSVVDVFFDC